MEFIDTLLSLWHGLFLPLGRLVFFVSLGLIVANFIEALHWTHHMARVAGPLIRLGHLSDIAGASFSMAFFSGVSANTMLSEGYAKKQISHRELLLANLFNSLPTYFLHLPTMFFITVPLIKGAALVYVGLTLFAAFLWTAGVLLLSRLMLPEPPPGCVTCRIDDDRPGSWRQALAKVGERFRRRIGRILLFTLPIYTIFFLLNRFGLFQALENMIADHVGILSWLHPQSLGIIVFHIAAEFTAGLAAAGALVDAGTLSERQIILALLIGNILSSPLRAMRHQFPYYAGIFSPRVALQLVLCNQSFRMASILVVTVGYAFLS